MSPVDRIFESNNIRRGEFQFDESVASVFDDMIERSVPLYAEVQRAIPALIKCVNHEPIRVLDLGCSTGTSLRLLSDSLPDHRLELWGIDNSAAMLQRCNEKLTALPRHHSYRLFQGDVNDFSESNLSVVLMNYTLQFVPIEQRCKLLSRIHQSLRPGGFLLLSEKFSHSDATLDREFVELYFEYKRAKGYSQLEIARKRDALEDVLVPCTAQQNREWLINAGFQEPELLLKWFNFGTFLCFR